MDVTITLTDEDEALFRSAVVEAPEVWIEVMVRGRINKAKNNLFAEWRQRFRDDPSVTAIPTDDDAYLEMILADPGYKTAAQKEPIRI